MLLPKNLAAAYGTRAIDVLASFTAGSTFAPMDWVGACLDAGLHPDKAGALLKDLLLEEAFLNGRPSTDTAGTMRYAVVLDPLTITVRQR